MWWRTVAVRAVGADKLRNGNAKNVIWSRRMTTRRRSSAKCVTHRPMQLYLATATICLQACLLQLYLPFEIKINVWNWLRFSASRILTTFRSFASVRDRHLVGCFSTVWRIAKVAMSLATICLKSSYAIPITIIYLCRSTVPYWRKRWNGRRIKILASDVGQCRTTHCHPIFDAF